MPETELPHLRRKNSRTFDLGDGRRRLEVGGDIANFQDENGDWLVTDLTWKDLTTKWGTGQYPFTIEFDKQSRTLTINWKNGDTLSLQPTGAQNPTDIVRDGSSLTFVNLWQGITLKVTLLPEGIKSDYTRTSETFTDPAYAISGNVAQYLQAPWYEDESGVVQVPFVNTGDALTIDMGSVPIGVTVDPTLYYGLASGDGEVYSPYGTWDEAHDATVGAAVDVSQTAITTGVMYSAPSYRIYRGFTGFDLTSASGGVESATITGTTVQKSGTLDLSLVEGTQASASSLATSDFDKVGTTELATRVTPPTSGTFVFTLNAAGLSHVQSAMGSYCKMAFLTAADFTDTAPGAQAWYAFGSQNHPTLASRVVLSVTYYPPVAYVAHLTFAELTNAASVTADLSGASVGDLACVLITCDNGSMPTNPSSVPSGWTLVQSSTPDQGLRWGWLYCKVLASGDLASHTWTWASALLTLKGTWVRYSGADDAMPIATSNKVWTTSPVDTALYVGSITSDKPMLVAFGVLPYATDSRTGTAPSGYTERCDDWDTVTDQLHYIADTDGTWAGGTSDPYITLSTSAGNRMGFHVAIMPIGAYIPQTFYQTARVIAAVPFRTRGV